MVESLAREMAPFGGRANAVLPGTMDTPANRAAMPDADPSQWASTDDVASVIHFLTTPAAAGRQRRRRAGPGTDPMSHLDCHVYYDSNRHPEPPAECGDRVDLAADPEAAGRLAGLGLSPDDLPAVLLTEPDGKIRIVGVRLTAEERPSSPTGEAASTPASLVVYSSSWCPDCRRAKRVLEEAEAPFDEVDIDQDAARRGRWCWSAAAAGGWCPRCASTTACGPSTRLRRCCAGCSTAGPKAWPH